MIPPFWFAVSVAVLHEFYGLSGCQAFLAVCGVDLLLDTMTRELRINQETNSAPSARPRCYCSNPKCMCRTSV